jgi:aminoglycoside phosphotransferase (APT) family kinase protein
MDRAAMAFAQPGLPVPEVLQVGEAMGRAFAISVRHHGRFLETIRPDEASAARAPVGRLLAALRAAPAHPDLPISWFPDPSQPDGSTWRGWLREGLVDDPKQLVSGWRAALAADPELDRLYAACERRIGELLEACPERRDLIHGDLLHQNVLIDERAEKITAVFSWKCSVRGDCLYDVAWLTFWAPWHAGIAALDLWPRALDALSPRDREDAAWRHHCYELHIGARHLGWSAWTRDPESLAAVATETARILERGPPPAA